MTRIVASTVLILVGQGGWAVDGSTRIHDESNCALKGPDAHRGVSASLKTAPIGVTVDDRSEIIRGPLLGSESDQVREQHVAARHQLTLKL